MDLTFCYKKINGAKTLLFLLVPLLLLKAFLGTRMFLGGAKLLRGGGVPLHPDPITEGYWT